MRRPTDSQERSGKKKSARSVRNDSGGGVEAKRGSSTARPGAPQTGAKEKAGSLRSE
jgi:hypothetical protein